MQPQDAIRESLAMLAAENGGTLTADAVVEVARDEKHPAHPYFDWEDSVAGHKWRIEQARQLIRSIRVEIVEREITTIVPCYVRDPRQPSGEQGYVSVASLRSDYDMALEAANDEFRRAASALRRARLVSDALGVSGDVDELISRVETVSTKANAPEAVA